MLTVPAAELQRSVGRLCEQAQTEPVVVTYYGKPSVVILSIAEYGRLKELDRRAVRLEDLIDPQIEEMLAASIPPEHRTSLSDIPTRTAPNAAPDVAAAALPGPRGPLRLPLGR